jgi:alpha-amylase
MDFILEEAYTKSYMPFFDVLKDFEEIKINLHFSGFLFSWLRERKPEYIKLLKYMEKKGQLEIVSGGMYEPVLSLVSEEDGVAQIESHMDLMESVFKKRPAGMWLAERVYEPCIPKVLNKAGISFTLVDDNHFKTVGLEEKDLYGYFISEYEGHPLAVFPGLEFLRYAIPFKQLPELDAYLKEIEAQKGDLVVFGDDGEKFGLWPGTYDYVYEEGWLRSFFQYLSDNSSWLKTVTFSEYMEKQPPKGRVYLSCESYKEMGEWSLPADLAKTYGGLLHAQEVPFRPFLRGGYYKNFLIKYSESNDMHKKMLRMSQKARKDKQAMRHVHMAQANDSYWHGVFGGLYLPHLRGSVYRHLIEAQKLLDPKKAFADGYLGDINFDGYEEAVLNNNEIEASFLLKEGGALYGFDYKPSSVNIMATLQRRYEGYHEKIKEAVSRNIADGTKTIHDMIIAKEEGLDEYLHYDWYRRGSLIDHVMGDDVTLESFYRGKYFEPGDFVREPYQGIIRKDKKAVRLSMERKGHCWQGGKGLPLAVRKNIVLQQGAGPIDVDYVLDGVTDGLLYFGVEFNFSLLGTGGDRFLETAGTKYPLTIKDVLGQSDGLRLYDPYQNVEILIEWNVPARIWTFPVEVVSLSENGFERNYQGTMVMPVWTIDLSGGSWNTSIRLHLKQAQ